MTQVRPMRQRVVLDTNVILSALVFGGGGAGRLRGAWQGGVCLPLVSAATVRELMHVLAYPKFKLTAAQQEDLLADYLPWTEAVRVSHPHPSVPVCRDPKDQMFLELAAAGHADVLITGDGDLLALAGQVPWALVSPADWLARIT
jgi:putative PIN family toxin of toxin-antitoxin system